RGHRRAQIPDGGGGQGTSRAPPAPRTHLGAARASDAAPVRRPERAQVSHHGRRRSAAGASAAANLTTAAPAPGWAPDTSGGARPAPAPTARGGESADRTDLARGVRSPRRARAGAAAEIGRASCRGGAGGT